MNKNKLFKVFVMIAFIMCSCEDNFDPKMYAPDTDLLLLEVLYAPI